MAEYFIGSDKDGWHVFSGTRKVISSLPNHQEASYWCERLRRDDEIRRRSSDAKSMGPLGPPDEL